MFVVRSLKIEFLASAVMDDLLTVETSVAAVRGASITFHQRVMRGDKALVTAEVLAASIRDGRPARIPAELASSPSAAGLTAHPANQNATRSPPLSSRISRASSGLATERPRPSMI